MQYFYIKHKIFSVRRNIGFHWFDYLQEREHSRLQIYNINGIMVSPGRAQLIVAGFGCCRFAHLRACRIWQRHHFHTPFLHTGHRAQPLSYSTGSTARTKFSRHPTMGKNWTCWHFLPERGLRYYLIIYHYLYYYYNNIMHTWPFYLYKLAGHFIPKTWPFTILLLKPCLFDLCSVVLEQERAFHKMLPQSWKHMNV